MLGLFHPQELPGLATRRWLNTELFWGFRMTPYWEGKMRRIHFFLMISNLLALSLTLAYQASKKNNFTLPLPRVWIVCFSMSSLIQVSLVFQTRIEIGGGKKCVHLISSQTVQTPFSRHFLSLSLFFVFSPIAVSPPATPPSTPIPNPLCFPSESSRPSRDVNWTM